jgi:hypothetical protein
MFQRKEPLVMLALVVALAATSASIPNRRKLASFKPSTTNSTGRIAYGAWARAGMVRTMGVTHPRFAFVAHSLAIRWS